MFELLETLSVNMEDLPQRLFLIWSESRGVYKLLSALLASEGWTVLIVDRLTSLSRFGPNKGKLVCLAVLDPRSRLASDEIDSVHEFLSKGNLALIASSAFEDDDSPTVSSIVSELCSPYGVKFNEDCVIRPNLYKLYHPQEAMIESYVANRGFEEVLKRHINQKPSHDHLSKGSDGPVKFGSRILYANGCTLDVNIKLSTIVATTSKWALPSRQPVGAFYRSTSCESRIVMLGSCQLFSDKYLAREDNEPFVRSIFEFLADKNFPINVSDARTIETVESNLTPDLDKLIQNPIGCLQSLEPLPENKAELIDARLFAMDTSQLSKVMEAYSDLGTAYEPLTLMKPSLRWSSTGETSHRLPTRFLLKRSHQ